MFMNHGGRCVLWPCRVLASAVVAMPLLAGCATVAPTQLDVLPSDDVLFYTLHTPWDEIDAGASQGVAKAQYAKSMVLAYGLKDQPKDEAQANTLKQTSMLPRQGTMITQYIAGINGQPGRVVPLYLPGSSGITPEAAKAAQGCIDVIRPTTASEVPQPDDTQRWEYSLVEGPNVSQLCGSYERYELLSTLWLSESPWGNWPLPRCRQEDERCKTLSAKVDRLNKRDPRREAFEAAASGDFRLGATNHIGPMPKGWDTVGVNCRAWTRDMVGKWHVNQDYIQPGDGAHTEAAMAFITVYNRALVTHPAFPFKDICVPVEVARVGPYDGPVTTYAEAARTSDVARLAEVPQGSDINAEDRFGITALMWATRNRDDAMTMALLDAGADPNRFPENGTGPLAYALKAEKYDLARSMIARGAKPKGNTGRCDRYGGWNLPPPGNAGCSWAGALAASKQFDLLDMLAASPDGENFLRSGGFELNSALLEALEAGDRQSVERLLPYVRGEGPEDYMAGQLADKGEMDLLLRYVVASGYRAARSPSEADLWRKAAQAGDLAAVQKLRSGGQNLNLLSAQRLEACAAAIQRNQLEVLDACIAEADARLEALKNAVTSGDEQGFSQMLVEASDIQERGKPSLLLYVVEHGSVSMLQQVLSRGFDFKQSMMGGNVMAVAARRGDVQRVRMLTDAGAFGTIGAIQTLGNLGNPHPMTRSLESIGGNADTEVVPNSFDASLLGAIDILTAEVARTDGPQALEASFKSAAYSGYNDVLEILLKHGLDLSKAEKPAEIWYAWAGLGQPCKPSTGRILIAAGLPIEYPPSDFSNDPALHTVAARCMNPRSIDVFVKGTGTDVNIRGYNGETALDQAEMYREPHLMAALQALGGKRSEDLDPVAHQARQAEDRISNDLDLEQSERF